MPPVFFNVSVCVDVEFTRTLPKPKLVGLVVKSPAATPVPESVMTAVPLSLTTDRLPVALPESAGANFTFTVALCPAAKVKGRVNPEML